MKSQATTKSKEVTNSRANSAIDELKQTKTSLEIDKREVGSAKSNITHRLDEIQFPLGKIPLGINEAISLFPLGITGGFIVCSILLYQSTRLRKRYHLEYVRKYDTSYNRTGTMISEELPTWIDPVSPWYIQILKSLVLFIPVIIFFLSWFLIIESWNLNSSTIAESILFGDRQTNQYVYNASNFITLILFIVCYVVIARECYGYEKSYLVERAANLKA